MHELHLNGVWRPFKHGVKRTLLDVRFTSFWQGLIWINIASQASVVYV
jgi:hypothetical protein